MKETLNLIKSLAEVTENSYLAHKISVLETQIEIAILDAEIKVYNNLLNK